VKLELGLGGRKDVGAGKRLDKVGVRDRVTGLGQ
jgi:hypothetical protein